MPYDAEISRNNPAAILLLVDQSRSMVEPFAGQPDQKKSEGVADAVNRLLQNLVLKSAKADGVRDYFHVGVIGYGTKLRCGLGGALPDDVLVPVGRVADSPLRIETRTQLVDDGAGEYVEQPFRFPVWFEARANGPTPMNGAFEAAEAVLKAFVAAHPASFPPIVINLTDGQPTDANPLAAVRRIGRLGTADGKALVFNLLISADPKPPVYFLASDELLVDPYAKLLFRMSSELPPRLMAAARAEGYDVQPGARGVVFNADLTAVVRFLDIGTRVSTVLR
jgi:hypothetical protein